MQAVVVKKDDIYLKKSGTWGERRKEIGEMILNYNLKIKDFIFYLFSSTHLLSDSHSLKLLWKLFGPFNMVSIFLNHAVQS